MDPRLKITKKIIGEWVKDNVERGGEDPILWGRKEANNQGVEENGEGETARAKNKKPPTSRKRMKELGEPVRKERRWCSREVMVKEEPHQGQETKEEKNETQLHEGRGLRKKKADRRVEMEKVMKEKREKKKERKRREGLEKLRQQGKEKNRGQRDIRSWLLGTQARASRTEEREGIG